MMETQSRRGFALPAAVFALVVVGVLVTGGYPLATAGSTGEIYDPQYQQSQHKTKAAA